ncbi:MAG: class I SAM-dependent methyltransferase [Candidatus Altiarchaeota archaeon]|nr:class I SAM-dependent methyltransferase [Candidatus Altiarchaeota archaeon]
MKLNLGCGRFRKEGFVNVDWNPAFKPDVVHDLNSFPYPFEDGSFDYIEIYHVLEHLDDVFKVMKEVDRILKKGGVLRITVPHFSRGFTHVEHKHGFDVTFKYYFDEKFFWEDSGIKLKCVKNKLIWFAQPYMKRKNLPSYIIAVLTVLGAGTSRRLR